MKLSGRRGRLVFAGAAIACAAGLLPSVALASAGQPTADAPACTASSTLVWLGLNPDGAALGTTYYPIEFTNVSHHTCTLFGYPGVAAINGTGQRVGPAAGHGGARHLVTLRRGQTTHALLGIVDAGILCTGRHAFTAAGLQVYPPNQSVKQPINSFTFRGCKNKVYMHVTSVQGGLGIP
jgi:Protein of unknown function (DUF4232)